MNTHRFFQFLSAMHPISSDLRQSLEKSTKAVSFPKGYYLVQAQSPAHHVYFLEKGFAVGFQYQAKKRVVTDFWQSNNLILSPKSFFGQWPTDEVIELTVDSELLSISYNAFRSIVEAFPAANSLARDITADYYARSEERIVDMHILDAWSRYLKLLKCYPGIEMNVTQELIASYLNITPQSLSRLKSEHQHPNSG